MRVAPGWCGGQRARLGGGSGAGRTCNGCPRAIRADEAEAVENRPFVIFGSEGTDGKELLVASVQGLGRRQPRGALPRRLLLATALPQQPALLLAGEALVLAVGRGGHVPPGTLARPARVVRHDVKAAEVLPRGAAAAAAWWRLCDQRRRGNGSLVRARGSACVCVHVCGVRHLARLALSLGGAVGGGAPHDALCGHLA